MSDHTKESLDNVSFRDLQQIAKDLELSGAGSRDDLTERILSSQTEVAPAAVPAMEPAQEAPPAPVEPGPVSEPAPEEPEVEPEPVSEPAPDYAEVSPRAKALAGQLIAGYIGVENYTKDVEKSVVEALAAGKQPCVVDGEGNNRFALKIHDQPFDRANLSSDVVPRRNGVVMNIARRLSDAGAFTGK